MSIQELTIENRQPFPFVVAGWPTVVELRTQTNWCLQHIGSWQKSWKYQYDADLRVYFWYFATQDDLTHFQLTWC